MGTGLQPRLSATVLPLLSQPSPRGPCSTTPTSTGEHGDRAGVRNGRCCRWGLPLSEPRLQGGDSSPFTSVSPRRRQLVHHAPLPAAWSHCLEGSEGPWGSDGWPSAPPRPSSQACLRVTPARRLEPRLWVLVRPVLQKGCRLAQRCSRAEAVPGTLLPSGLELRPVPSLACWLLSWGAQQLGQTLPTVTAHTWPSSFPPCGLAQEGTCLTPAHHSGPSNGPAALGDGCQVGRPSPRGSQAQGFRQEDGAPCPQPADLPTSAATASQSPAGPLCQPSLSVGLLRSHPPGALPREPCPLPLSGAPGAPLSLAPTHLGPRGSACAVCGFCGCDAPAPGSCRDSLPLAALATLMINSGLPVNIAGFADAQLLGHAAGCHGLTRRF